MSVITIIFIYYNSLDYNIGLFTQVKFRQEKDTAQKLVGMICSPVLIVHIMH